MVIGKKQPWVEVAVVLLVMFFLATSIYYRNWTGFIAGVFSFTPLILFYIHYQRKFFIAAAFVITVGFILFFNRFEPLFLVLTYFGSSAAMGEMIRRKKPVERSVLLGMAPPLISGSGLWFLEASKNQTDPVSYFHRIILQNLKETVLYYQKIGVDKEKIDYLNSSLSDLANLIFYLFPGIYLSGLILTLFLNYLLVRFILMKLNYSTIHFKPLSSWFASDSLVWGVILSGIFLMIPWDGFKMIGGNLLILFILLYFFQGLALVADFLKKKQIKPLWQAFSYILLILWPLLGGLVALLGLFDIWVDFRKVRGAPH